MYARPSRTRIENDDAFSTGTRLERVGVIGPELELSLGRSAGFDVELLCKNKKIGGSAGASPVAAPMPKSVPP